MSSPNHTANVYRSALIGLILCAFALRVYKLDSQSLWYDEGVTAIVAQYDLASLAQWTADDIQPPLYYALVAGWGRLGGWGEWSLRFPSAFFGLLIVPLLTALAIRWGRSRLTGAIAGGLAALHPLLLYYSQEARMYALLVALGVGAAYCMQRVIDFNAEAQRRRGAEGKIGGKNIWLLWLGYIFFATAALYTHYFAAFLLLAVNVAYLLHVLQTTRLAQSPIPSSQSPILIFLPWLLANAAVLLLYLPWLGNLVTRLEVDASYWEGSLKVWEALRAVAIRFTSGETVLEVQATRLLWMYGAVTLLAGWGLGSRDRGSGTGNDRSSSQSPVPSPQYPLLLLLFPIVAILALASFTPKFNARYVMVALPGLLLLWSGGLAGLLRAFVPLWQRMQRVACNTEPRALPALAGLVGTGLLLAGFVHADRNWFRDPAFTKDQWRELAAFVRGQMADSDAVVLVSGHAWPVWRYYAPDIDPVRLPPLEILDVKAVLDLESSADFLRPALLNKNGAWLVQWQEEVIDPTDAAGLQLERAGSERPVDAQFWGLKLRRFADLDARRISNAPPIQQPVQINFGGQVELLGSTVEASGDLLLFWRLTQPQTAMPDLYLTGETRTADGLLFARLGDRRLAAYDFPTFRWQIGQVVAGRIPVDEWMGAGAPAGRYLLRLGVYDPAGDPAGLDVLGAGHERLGKRTTIEIELQQPVALLPGEDPTTWHPLAGGLFARPILVNSSAGAGETILLQMLWFGESAQSVGPLIAHWQESTGAARWEGGRLDVALTLPAAQAVRTVHSIPVPLDLPPGEYRLELSVTGESVRPLQLPVTIFTAERNFELPPLDPTLSANFGNQVTLIGLTSTPLPAQIAPGVPLPLTLVWQTRAARTDYTVSVQWLDSQGRPAGQRDERLPRGSSTWLPGEVVSQSLDLAAPQQPGEYRLIVAVYDAESSGLPRLHLPDGADFVEVARITVLP